MTEPMCQYDKNALTHLYAVLGYMNEMGDTEGAQYVQASIEELEDKYAN